MLKMKKLKFLWLCLVMISQVYLANGQEFFQTHHYNAASNSENKLFHSIQASDGTYFAVGYYNTGSSPDVPVIMQYAHDGTVLHEYTYGFNGYFDDIIIDHNGDLVIGGMYESANTYFCIIKVKQDGTPLAFKYYDYTSPASTFSQSFSIIETSVSGSYTGYMAAGTIAGSTNYSIMIVKTDANLSSTTSGNFQQQISQTGKDCYGVSVVQKGSNDFVLFGSIGDDCYIREFDNTGTVIGGVDKLLHGNTGHVLFPQSMKIVTGGYLLTGDDIVAGGSPSSYALLMKLDASLNFSWAHTFSNNAYSSGRDILEDGSGNYEMAALEGNFISIVKTNTSGTSPVSTGYNHTGFYSEPYSIIQAADGDFVIAGFTNNSTGSWTQQYFNLTKADGTTSGGCNATSISNTSDAALSVSNASPAETTGTITGENSFSITRSFLTPTSAGTPPNCHNCIAPTTTVTVTIPSGGCSVNGPHPTLTATAIPGAYYQWRRNGTNIGSTSTSPSFAASADGATYDVIVSYVPDCSSCFVTSSNSVTTYITFSGIVANLTSTGYDAWGIGTVCVTGGLKLTLDDLTDWSLSSEYSVDPFSSILYDFSTSASGYTISINWGDGSSPTTYSNPVYYSAYGFNASTSHTYSAVSAITHRSVIVSIFDLAHPNNCPSVSTAYDLIQYPPPTSVTASEIDNCSGTYPGQVRVIEVSANMQSTGTFQLSASAFGGVGFSLITGNPTFPITYSGGVLTQYYYVNNPEFTGTITVKAFNPNECAGSTLFFNMNYVTALNNANIYPVGYQILNYDMYVDTQEPNIDLTNWPSLHGVTIGSSNFTSSVSGCLS
jgi:hypothetical protein